MTERNNIELNREPREPKPLSAEYHKAHKQLMLWGSILLIWELVGVDLQKAKDAGGNVGAIVQSLKSPQAVPFVLISLISYFLFKSTIEWRQCSQARRAVGYARADYFGGIALAVIGYGVYIIQSAIRVQLADKITVHQIAVVCFTATLVLVFHVRSGFSKGWYYFSAGALALSIVLASYQNLSRHSRWWVVLILVVSGGAVGVIIGRIQIGLASSLLIKD